MSAPGRTALLDAAEELFAAHGIGAVSNRRIVEQAGAANHSAISYHFGGRDGLITALVDRHEEQLTPYRTAHLNATAPPATTHEAIRSRLIPLVELFDRLPRPSWRAQFLSQARADPSARTAMIDAARRSTASLMPDADQWRTDIPPKVLRARIGLVANLVIGVCAQHEKQMHEGTNSGSWLDVGHFLVDATAGMIEAPVTYPGPVPRDESPPLI